MQFIARYRDVGYVQLLDQLISTARSETDDKTVSREKQKKKKNNNRTPFATVGVREIVEYFSLTGPGYTGT
jgi:hypothetical protein